VQAQTTGVQGGLRERILAMMAQAQAAGDRRVTQINLARESGVPREQINRIVNGRAAETDDQAARILRTMAEWGYADHDEASEAAPEAEAHVPQEALRRAVQPQTAKIHLTEDYRDAMGWLGKVRNFRAIGVMIGSSGAGKTTALQEYERITPGAHRIVCRRSMWVGDLVWEMARAIGVTLRGKTYRQIIQLQEELARRDDVMFLFDEAQQLRRRNSDKLEEIRQIWDESNTPVVLAGTNQLQEVLAHWTGSDDVSQLASRMAPFRFHGIREPEVRALLREYDLTADAVKELVEVALDKENGGMRNLMSILSMCLEAAKGDRIDRGMVREAMGFKLPV